MVDGLSHTDYLTLVRSAPIRAVDAKTCRVRSGNLRAGPASEMDPIAEGITDFGRRWTYIRQDLPASKPARPPGRLGAALLGFVTKAVSGEMLYIDGIVFRGTDEGPLTAASDPIENGPRHPNDPVWCLDALYGASEPIENHPEETLVGAGADAHLAGVADLHDANISAPHGLRPPIAGRGFYRGHARFHVWLADGLALRIATEHESGYPRQPPFWAATEFWDFGVDVDETLRHAVNQRVVRSPKPA